MTFIYNNLRIISYETFLFNTIDGDLDLTQYAIDEYNNGYYIRIEPKNQSQFIHIDLNFNDINGNNYTIDHLTQVEIVHSICAYYNEFLTAYGATNLSKSPKTLLKLLPVGSTIRVKTTKEEYFSQNIPIRAEEVNILPPDIFNIEAKKHYCSPVLETINEFNKFNRLLTLEEKKPHSISYDFASTSGQYNPASSYTWNHTCGSTANILIFGNSSTQDSGDSTVSSVTYNGITMTFARTDTIGISGNTRTTIYYLLAPPTGSAYAITVTLSSSAKYVVGGAVSYSGAKQEAMDAVDGNVGQSGSPSMTITTIADNCWVFSCLSTHGASAPICNNTIRWDVGGSEYGSDTGGPVTPPGSQTMSWSGGLSKIYAMSAVSFAPAIYLKNIISKFILFILSNKDVKCRFRLAPQYSFGKSQISFIDNSYRIKKV